MGTGDASPERNVDSLPSGWYAQVFNVREEGHGEVTLYNEFHKKCLSMSASSAGNASTCGPELRSHECTQEPSATSLCGHVRGSYSTEPA